MRAIALGRKNWLHIGSPQAGPKVGAILSVVESCRRLKLPVRNYLAAVLPGFADSPDPTRPRPYACCVGRPAFINSNDPVVGVNTIFSIPNQCRLGEDVGIVLTGTRRNLSLRVPA